MRAFVQLASLLLFLLTLSLPFAQDCFEFVEESRLMGVETKQEPSPLSVAAWHRGNFQNAVGQNRTRSFGLRPTLVRTDNQLNLTAFGSMNANIYRGPRGHLFSNAYAIGKDWDRSNGKWAPNRLVLLQRAATRLRARGVHVALLISPSKNRFMPENLPALERAAESTGNQTRYDNFMQTLRGAAQRPAFALHDTPGLFQEWKGAKAGPLFPRAGVHWSRYGGALMASRILREAAADLAELSHIEVARVVEKKEPIGTDRDLLQLSNIWFEREFFDRTVEPIGRIANPDRRRPRVLLIGTSFTWTIADFLARSQATERLEVWYYNRSIAAYKSKKRPPRTPLPPPGNDLMDRLSEFDVVIFESPQHALQNLGNGLLQQIQKAKD